jgi:hypothetical protein
MIARGVNPGEGIMQALTLAEELKNRRETNKLHALDQQFRQQRYADQQEQEQALAQQAQEKAAAEEEGRWLYPLVKQRNPEAIKIAVERASKVNPRIGDMYRVDPEATAAALEQAMAQQFGGGQPVAPPQVQRDGGYSYLFDPSKGVIPGSVQPPQRAPIPRPSSGPAPAAPTGQPAPLPIKTLTPDELQAKGYPEGSVVQTDTRTGKDTVVSKSDYTPKDINTARSKLTMIGAARKALADARAKFSTTPSAEKGGPVAGGLSAVGVYGEGQKFQAAIDGLRGSITAITKVPGLGSMSDYETRLDQAKFPSFWFDREETMDQKMQQLETLLETLEGGYADIAGASATAKPANRVRYDAQGNRL